MPEESQLLKPSIISRRERLSAVSRRLITPPHRRSPLSARTGGIPFTRRVRWRVFRPASASTSPIARGKKKLFSLGGRSFSSDVSARSERASAREESSSPSYRVLPKPDQPLPRRTPNQQCLSLDGARRGRSQKGNPPSQAIESLVVRNI
jgi:hypothetical protein